MRPVESLMFPFLQAGLAVPFHTLTFSKYHGASSWGFPGSSVVKNLPSVQEMRVQSLGREDPLEEEMANPLQYPCLKNPMDRGAWWAATQRVLKNCAQLSD